MRVPRAVKARWDELPERGVRRVPPTSVRQDSSWSSFNCSRLRPRCGCGDGGGRTRYSDWNTLAATGGAFAGPVSALPARNIAFVRDVHPETTLKRVFLEHAFSGTSSALDYVDASSLAHLHLCHSTLHVWYCLITDVMIRSEGLTVQCHLRPLTPHHVLTPVSAFESVPLIHPRRHTL